MKLRIVENGNQFVILYKTWLTEWEVLTAKRDFRFSFRDRSDWEFYHHKFDTLQDAERFAEQRIEQGRDVWVAWRPDNAETLREYK